MSIQNLKFAFIGGGNMASAILAGLKKAGVDLRTVLVIEHNEAARERLAKQFAITATNHPTEALKTVDVIVLAVKPQQFHTMAEQLHPYITQQLLLSVAAGIRLADLSQCFNGHTRIIRTMPNTPALIGAGMTGLAAPSNLSPADRLIAEKIAQAIGEYMWVENDDQIDALTTISGSGPAYVFYLIEAMEVAAKNMGLTEAQGKKLATATFIGAAQLAQNSTDSACELRRQVTSPNGTTYAALQVLETHAVQKAFQEALYAAQQRSIEMADEFSQAHN